MVEKKKWSTLAGRGDWLHLARFRFFQGRGSRLHTHDFAELFWVEEGSGVHFINYQRKRLDAGDLIFIRPSDRHYLQARDSDGFILVNLAFPAAVQEELLRRHSALRRFYPRGAGLPERYRLSQLQLSELQEEVRRLNLSDGSRLSLERFLLVFYVLLLPVDDEARPALPSWLEQACVEIRRPEHFSGGTRAFVKLAGRSAEHVARTTHQLLGLSPTDYINQVRMEYAARELRLGNRPILEIALECGITNLSYFYTLFRRFHHTTPRDYRVSHQVPII